MSKQINWAHQETENQGSWLVKHFCSLPSLKQCCGLWFWPNSDPELCASNKRCNFKYCHMNIKENAYLSFLFPYFCCQMSLVNRTALYCELGFSKSQSAIRNRITIQGLYGIPRTSDTKNMATKRKLATLSKIFIQKYFKYHSFVRGTEPWIWIWPQLSTIRIRNTGHLKLPKTIKII